MIENKTIATTIMVIITSIHRALQIWIHNNSSNKEYLRQDYLKFHLKVFMKIDLKLKVWLWISKLISIRWISIER